MAGYDLESWCDHLIEVERWMGHFDATLAMLMEEHPNEQVRILAEARQYLMFGRRSITEFRTTIEEVEEGKEA